MEYMIISDAYNSSFNDKLQLFCNDGWVPDGELIVTALFLKADRGNGLMYTQRLKRVKT